MRARSPLLILILLSLSASMLRAQVPEQELTTGIEIWQRGELDAAKIYFEDLLKRFPEDPDVLFMAGRTAGRWDEAQKYFKRAEVAGYGPDATVYRADAYWWLEKRRRAGRMLKKMLLSYPDHRNGWFLLGDMYRIEEDYAPAIAAYRKAYSLDSMDFSVFLAIQDALLESGEYADAAAGYTQYLSMHSWDEHAMRQRGYARFMLGRYTEAREDYSASLEIDSTHAWAWVLKGICLMREDKDWAAEPCFERVVKDRMYSTDFVSGIELYLNSPYPEALRQIGLIRARQGDWEWAALYFADATREIRDPEYSPAWSDRSDALRHLSRLDEALEAANWALKCDKHNLQARYRRGLVYAELGKAGKAKSDFKKVLKGDDAELREAARQQLESIENVK